MAKICICGEPVGECIDCYPDNFDSNGVRIVEGVENNIVVEVPVNNEEIPINNKLEKLETSAEYNNKIFGYISELGKLFTKTVDSSKWSQEVKGNMKNNFLKIEKIIKNEFKPDMGKKKCNKSDCDCHDCGEKKGKRWTAKKFLITIAKTEAPRTEVLNYYLNNMGLKEIAVARETHKDGDHHLHVYMEFTAKKNIKSPKYFMLPNSFEKYGNTMARIDTLGKKTKEQVFSYLLKEDKKVCSYGFNIRQDVHGKLKAKDQWYKIAIEEWTIGDMVLYDPSWLGKDIERLHDRYINNLKYLKKYFNITNFYQLTIVNYTFKEMAYYNICMNI